MLYERGKKVAADRNSRLIPRSLARNDFTRSLMTSLVIARSLACRLRYRDAFRDDIFRLWRLTY